MLPLNHRDSAKLEDVISILLMGLPEFSGSPIFLSIGSQLTAHGGKLLSGSPERGTQIHAASFIRERHIVLDSYLLGRSRLLRLILVHEIFHFVWPRLGNPARTAYAELLVVERNSRARGELGESAVMGKLSFHETVDPLRKEQRWREYVCESFCDTAAWMYAGVSRHREFTLATRWRRSRSKWFEAVFSVARRC